MVSTSLFILTDANGFTTCIEEWTEALALREAGRIPLLAPIEVCEWGYYGSERYGEWRFHRSFTWPSS